MWAITIYGKHKHYSINELTGGKLVSYSGSENIFCWMNCNRSILDGSAKGIDGTNDSICDVTVCKVMW